MTQPLGTPADPINPQHYQGFSNDTEIVKDDHDSTETWILRTAFSFIKARPGGIESDTLGSPDDDAPTAERASRGGVVDD